MSYIGQLSFVPQYMEELKANNAVELWDHYQVMNKSHVDITNFGEYFITAIETLLVAQRKLHVKVDKLHNFFLFQRLAKFS